MSFYITNPPKTSVCAVQVCERSALFGMETEVTGLHRTQTGRLGNEKQNKEKKGNITSSSVIHPRNQRYPAISALLVNGVGMQCTENEETH